MKIDALNGVKTIPGLLGVENTYSLSFICLFIAAGIHFYMQNDSKIVDYRVPVGVSMLITGLTVYTTRKKQDNFLYFGLLDGMILIQFLLIYSYSHLHE